MALWYHCGNGWLKTRGMARCRLGADAYLCCPGPSLAGVNAAALNGPGRMVFAITTAYPTVRPDVWVGTDVPECYDRRIWAEPFTKIVRGSHHDMSCEGRPLRDFPNVLFADLEDGPVSEMFHRRAHDAVFLWNMNTFTTALHLAVWMGARRIFLVGCDFGGTRDYHDDRHLSKERRKDNRRLYANLVKDLRRLAPEARTHGIEMVSCTAGSPVNEFMPFLDLASALEASESEAPDRRAPVLHAADAQLCHWSNYALQNRGVVVGLDAAQEWLVPWWFSRLRQQSDLPVAFADYGMTVAMRRWCAERGKVLDIRDGAAGNACYRKPFAILRAPFKEVLYLEPDCEIRGALEPLFGCCGDGNVGLSPAAIEVQTAGRRPGNRSAPPAVDCPDWDTGVVVVQHGHPLITDWAAEVLAWGDRYPTDRAALAQVIARSGYAAEPIPPSLVSGPEHEDSGAAVVHWAGDTGKAVLRERLGGSEGVPFVQVASTPPGWSAEPEDALGIVVPASRGNQDLLAWWWWAYCRRNRWPVAFADFGMDDETRRWCEARGKVISPSAPEGIDGKFRKPFAILAAPFKQVVWTDVDCEIREDIAILANRCGSHPGLGRDWSYPAALAKLLPFKGPCWSTALVAVTHGDPLVVQWAGKVAEDRQGFRGDQEVLSAILNQGRHEGFVDIPVSLLRSRQEGEDEGLVAVHWSGPGGKSAIRRAWPAIRAGFTGSMMSAFRHGWTESEPSADRGVIVGLDESQEWLMDWWWSNYARHNTLPVHFVDFGLSARTRTCCAARGTLSEPVLLDCYGWFKKPLALLRSPFRKALWLDMDCEVRSPLDPLFGFCGNGSIGLTLDRGSPQQYREAMPPDAPIFNSGLVAFNHGDPAIPQWASMTLALRSDCPGDARFGQPGDQETLALALRRYAQGRVREIPKELMRLRLSDGDGPALVMHWTGPVGKDHIRQAADSETDRQNRRGAAVSERVLSQT